MAIGMLNSWKVSSNRPGVTGVGIKVGENNVDIKDILSHKHVGNRPSVGVKVGEGIRDIRDILSYKY
jgi:hypothetical protein